MTTHIHMFVTKCVVLDEIDMENMNCLQQAVSSEASVRAYGKPW